MLKSFVSFERLLTVPLKTAINLKENQRIHSMVIDIDGITVNIEN